MGRPCPDVSGPRGGEGRGGRGSFSHWGGVCVRRGGWRICNGRFLNSGRGGGADGGGIGETAEDGDVTGERDAEADGNGELRDAAGAAQERGQIIGESIFRAGNTGAGDEIEEAGGAGGDFGEALVRGSGRAKEDRVEMMSGEAAARVPGCR